MRTGLKEQTEVTLMYKNTFIFNNFKTTAFFFFTVKIFKWNNKTKNSIYICIDMTHAFVLLCLIQVLQLSASFNPLKPWLWFGFNALSNIIRRDVRILVCFFRPAQDRMCVRTDWRDREGNRTPFHVLETKS